MRDEFICKGSKNKERDNIERRREKNTKSFKLFLVAKRARREEIERERIWRLVGPVSLSMGASRQREGKDHVTKVSKIKKVILFLQGQIVLRSNTEIQRIWRLNMGACRQREGRNHQTKVSAIKKEIKQEQIVLGSEESKNLIRVYSFQILDLSR